MSRVTIVALRVWLRAVLAAAWLTSCSGVHEAAAPRLRATFEAEAANPARVTVWLESAEGLLLNGALALCQSPDGSSMVLNYDPDRGAYTKLVGAAISGDYQIRVRSAAFTQDQYLTLPFVQLASAPALTTLNDSDGKSALLGETLNSGLTLNLAWTPVQGATSYFLRIWQGPNLVKTISTSQSLTQIAPGELPPGTYLVSVTAQYLSGDPLFLNQSYLVTGQRSGPSVQCTLTAP